MEKRFMYKLEKRRNVGIRMARKNPDRMISDLKEECCIKVIAWEEKTSVDWYDEEGKTLAQ